MAEGKFTTVGEVMRHYSQIIMDSLKANLSKKDERGFDHLATYKLLQSIQCPITIYADKYVMEIKMEDYWKYVEEGRKPGKYPPPEPIIRWTVAKGLDIGKLSERRKRKIRALKTKRMRKAIKQISVLSLRKQLAFLVSRKIATEGIPPSYFVSKVINDDLFLKIKEDLRIAAKKDIPILFKQDLITYAY